MIQKFFLYCVTLFFFAMAEPSVWGAVLTKHNLEVKLGAGVYVTIPPELARKESTQDKIVVAQLLDLIGTKFKQILSGGDRAPTATTDSRDNFELQKQDEENKRIQNEIRLLQAKETVLPIAGIDDKNRQTLHDPFAVSNVPAFDISSPLNPVPLNPITDSTATTAKSPPPPPVVPATSAVSNEVVQSVPTTVQPNDAITAPTPFLLAPAKKSDNPFDN